MARRPSPLPPELTHAVLARSELVAAGVSESRLRCSDLERLRRGIYAVRGREISEADIARALQAEDPGLVVRGASLARILGAPLPAQLSSWGRGRPVEVAVRSPGARGTSDRVVAFHAVALSVAEVGTLRVRSGDGRELVALRCTRTPRLFRDLAEVLGHDDLVAAGDFLVRRPRPALERRRRPHASIEELRAQSIGRRAAVLRRAVEDVRVGADSPMETRLRLAFCRAGLPEPEINTPLVGPSGPVGSEPDFQWPQFRLCAEYDGRTHSTPDQIRKDVARAVRVELAGFTEIRFAADDAAHGCARAVRRVRDALRTRGWDG